MLKDFLFALFWVFFVMLAFFMALPWVVNYMSMYYLWVHGQFI